MIRLIVLASMILGGLESAAAAPWSLGSVVESESSGLSLLYRHRPREAIHMSAAFFERRRFTVEGNWQRFFVPSKRAFDYQIYSGIGLRGEAIQDERQAEAYDLSLPIGIQWTPRGLPVEVFGEAGALVGPVPATSTRGRIRGGLRATF